MRAQPRAERGPSAAPAQLAGDPRQTQPRGRPRGEAGQKPDGGRAGDRGTVSDLLQSFADGQGTAGGAGVLAGTQSESPRGRGGSGLEHDEFVGVHLQSLSARKSCENFTNY